MAGEPNGIGSREHRPPKVSDEPPAGDGGGGGGPEPGFDDGGLFQTRYREVTLSAIIFGVVVGVIMNMAITYAGLKIGFTIVGSSIAAVLGFGVLRGLLRRGSILEVNIGQTIASAVNTPNSGVIFTVPVLFLIGVPLVDGRMPNSNFWLLTLACVAGAVMGCAFIVPLRKQMLDIERLRFPSATAVGAILKSPGAGASKSIVLVIGIVLSALIALPAQLPQISILAAEENLGQLLEDGKITLEQKMLTELIADWQVEQTVPLAVMAHGRLLVEISEAERLEREADVTLLSAALPGTREKAFDEIRQLTQRGAYAVTSYPDDLAEQVFRAVESEDAALWRGLRSAKTGWAERPLWGYSDLNLRVAREVEEGAPAVDFAGNGLGGRDEVLTENSDRDRDGRPDLLVTNDTVDVGRFIGLPPQMQLIFAIAPFALGAGYLTGRPGLFVLAGGILAYLVLNPILFGLGWMPETISAVAAPGFGYGQINRPLGIGLLLGGAMMGVLASLPAIREALKSIAAAGVQRVGSDELGMKVLVAAVLFAFVFLFASSYISSQRPINTVDPITAVEIEEVAATDTANGYTLAFGSAESFESWKGLDEEQRDATLKSMKANRPGLLAALHPIVRALIISIIGAGWIWFAGIIIAQCTGMTDWSPISGMALITVVLVMVLAGVGDQIGAVMIGAALCVAITCAADMMADLKTGYIVGAQPRRQQIVEMISTGIGPIITMGVLLVIAAANMERFGVAMGPETDTTAPQAQALQAVITGVQGGDMPYALYGFGAILGALLGLGSFAGLGVLVGLSMYLPMVYIATYGIGCVVNMIVSRVKGRSWAEEWGVPLAAGFIVGDALLGLSVNFIVLLTS